MIILVQRNSNEENIPDIDGLVLTNKEKYYYRMVNNFFKTLDQNKIDNMIDIMKADPNFIATLGLVRYRYSNKYKISYKLNTDDDWGLMFILVIKSSIKILQKDILIHLGEKSKFYYYFNKKKKPNTWQQQFVN